VLCASVYNPILVALLWELTKETMYLPLGCLQGGVALIVVRYRAYRRTTLASFCQKATTGGIPTACRAKELLPVKISCQARSNRGEYFWKIRFRGSPILFAMKHYYTIAVGCDQKFTCVVIFVEKSYFSEILAAMTSETGKIWNTQRFGFCRDPLHRGA